MGRKPEDLTGRAFGKLTALYPLAERSGPYVVWRCRCSCGQECEVSSRLLKMGRQTACAECSGKQKIPGTKVIDLTGLVFGKLEVVCFAGKDKWGQAVWHCLCACGGECDVRADYLKSGWKGSCGVCDGSAKVPGTQTLDITAQRFGFLVAVERHRTRKDGHAIWTCRCDCGNLCYVPADYLIKGKQTSCRLCSLPRTAKACLHWQERED